MYGNILASSYDDTENESEVASSKMTTKIVIARKARYVGTAGEIRVGDRVEVTSWFDYVVGGERTRYAHVYRRVTKGSAWAQLSLAL
ncbi:MAG: hypothetical protein A2Y38_23445 [Spirochaetes bacterium GWB1_59_5]|nr:MAG: hypothetical protein A2Y38_23445 [Spirochaetes bacterium GWB1_59_5]